jgi:DNA polymerase III, alpha subunit
MGLEVLPPSINRSQSRFTVEQGPDGAYRVRFGLAAIKNAGGKAINAMIDAREEHGPFDSIFDLTKNVDLGTVNKRTLEALAQAGALDDLEGHRAQLMEIMDKAVRYGQKVQHDRMAGQNSLFGNGDAGTEAMQPGLPDVETWAKSQRLKEEHEVLGFYVSGHPLDEYRAEADAFATAHFRRAGPARTGHRTGRRGRRPQPGARPHLLRDHYRGGPQHHEVRQADRVRHD